MGSPEPMGPERAWQALRPQQFGRTAGPRSTLAGGALSCFRGMTAHYSPGDASAEGKGRALAHLLVTMIGIGYLFPIAAIWSAFDFWKALFPGSNIEFSVTVVYQATPWRGQGLQRSMSFAAFLIGAPVARVQVGKSPQSAVGRALGW